LCIKYFYALFCVLLIFLDLRIFGHVGSSNCTGSLDNIEKNSVNTRDDVVTKDNDSDKINKCTKYPIDDGVQCDDLNVIKKRRMDLSLCDNNQNEEAIKRKKDNHIVFDCAKSYESNNSYEASSGINDKNKSTKCIDVKNYSIENAMRCNEKIVNYKNNNNCKNDTDDNLFTMCKLLTNERGVSLSSSDEVLNLPYSNNSSECEIHNMETMKNWFDENKIFQFVPSYIKTILANSVEPVSYIQSSDNVFCIFWYRCEKLTIHTNTNSNDKNAPSSLLHKLKKVKI